MRIKFLFFALCLAICGSASANDHTELKRTVDSAFSKVAVAFKKKDQAAVDKLMRMFLSRDYVGIAIDGSKRNLAQTMAQMRQHLKTSKSISRMTMSVSNVKVTGTKGTATGEFNLTGVIHNDKARGKTSKLRVWEKSKDEYRKVNGRWMLVKSATLDGKVWIDGKLMPAGVG